MNKTVQEPVMVLPVGKNVVMLGENPNLSIYNLRNIAQWLVRRPYKPVMQVQFLLFRFQKIKSWRFRNEKEIIN